MTTAVATSSPAFLSAEEIDELCAPLTQRHAQLRYLCMLLGVASLPRRPDGLPIVGRKLIEAKLNGDDLAGSSAFNWTK